MHILRLLLRLSSLSPFIWSVSIPLGVSIISLCISTEKDENHNEANDDVVEFLNLDDIEIPDITGADSKLEKLTSEYTIAN